MCESELPAPEWHHRPAWRKKALRIHDGCSVRLRHWPKNTVTQLGASSLEARCLRGDEGKSGAPRARQLPLACALARSE
jgi:hypothetical protein